MQVPTNMKAVEASAMGLKSLHPVSGRSVPWPAPEADSNDVLIKIEYTALNPIDWKLLEFDVLPLEWPCCLGCDASGTIAAAPPGSPWTVGDRVWAYTNIGKPYSGSFAEYVRVPGDVVGSVPDGVGMDAASTVGLGTITASLGLFSHMKLPMEASEANGGTTVLVYGASSITGMYTIGLLKAAGYRVVGVASTRNHDVLKQTWGADECWDYKEEGWTDAVAAANPGMRHVYDAIGGPAIALCDEVLQKCGGEGPMLATVDPFTATETKARQFKINAMVCYEELREDSVRFVKAASELLASGKLPLAPVEVLEGLEAVPEGLEMLKGGKMSGKKIVVKV